MFPKLQAYINQSISETSGLPEERRELLDQLAAYIIKKKQRNEPVQLVFICTHNSRRSILSEIWAAAAAHVAGVDGCSVYSGGTEATAFHPHAQAALERAGFATQSGTGPNPRVRVRFAEDVDAPEVYSKTYDDPANPSRAFAAIMTCSDADANCPFIPGAEFRLALKYNDPKEADGTPDEKTVYDERCRQIATEILYAFLKAKESL